MIKKYINTEGVIVLLGLLIHLVISQILGREYARYFMYVLILIMIPFIIFNLVKQRKEDKTNGTENFKLSIYNILIATVFMGILFFVINSNYPTGF